MGYITFPLSSNITEQLRIIQSRFMNSGGIVVLNEDENSKCFDVLNEMISRQIITDAEINGACAYQIIGNVETFFEWVNSNNEEALLSKNNTSERKTMNSYEKLVCIINQIDDFIDKQVTSKDPGFQAWKSETNRFLIGQYGERSYEYKEFNSFRFAPAAIPFGQSDRVFVDACKKDLEQVKAILQSYLKEIPDSATRRKDEMISVNNKVFIVHGHDDLAKITVARSLERMGFEAIILHEQPDEGKTIIEKIEKYSDVSYAVVIYTECDIGRDKTKGDSMNRNRARQNVVFEHGYLIGKLGRDHVCALVKGDVETPGDISGVVYTPMDDNMAWEVSLYKNMKAIGISVDMNKLC